jgi:hypothetical protein
MHHDFIAHSLHIKPRPGRSKGPEADGDAENPIGMRADRHQFGEYVVWRHRCWFGPARTPGQTDRGRAAQEIASIHR